MNSIKLEIIPDILLVPGSEKRYVRGRFLGKGGFAECYELTDSDTDQIFAGKIFFKKQQLLPKRDLMSMITHEILIHHSLVHKHVVECHSWFENIDCYVIVMELCKGGSLAEFLKKRKSITEAEARCFMHQLLLGVRFLHRNNIVHGNLKVSNLFLTENMKLKIGDFGLATDEIDFYGERKKTLCGTPSCMAPEVLSREGHCYEVDIWSMGCILYALLAGCTPFETMLIKDVYSTKKKNEFHVPSRIGPLAGALIIKMLQADPSKRPTVDQCLSDDFMKGDMPSSLAFNSLTRDRR